MIQVKKEGNWLEQQAKQNPDSVALTSGGRELTFKETYQWSLSISRRLAEFGIGKNNHVAIILNNSLEYILVINAVWLTGCIPVTINPRLTQQNIRTLIEHSSAQLVISGDANISYENNIVTINIDKLMADSGEGNKSETSRGREAVLIYTSGTSGNPKGVPVTFSNLFESVSAVDELDKYSVNDSFMLSLPLYHIGGFSIMVRSLLAGSRLIIPENLNLSDLYPNLVELKPGIVSLVPTMLKTLIDKEAVLPGSIRLIYIGGGPSHDSIIEKALELKYPIVKVYGSTETCAMTTYADAELLRSNPGTSGVAIGNAKIEILDEKKQKLTPGKSGEIVIQSGSLFEGYYRNYFETAGRLVNGKYFSGDIGYMDKEGNLFVESRREDIIVTGGENVSPAEIVNELNKHPAVSDSAVFAVNDSHWGQMVCAAVVTRGGRPASAEELSRFLRKSLPSFKIPKQYYFIDNLPCNEVGKVNIEELKGLLNLNI